MQAQPRGYYDLPVGTEFIVIDNRCYPTHVLAGEVRRGCFYPFGGNDGHMIRVRQETMSEAAMRVNREKAGCPSLAVAGLDPTDRK